MADVDTGKSNDPRFTAENFVPCRCGKERYAADELARRFAKLGLCRACEMDFMKVQDMCPESLIYANGVIACGGTWAHSGRCFPSVTYEDSLRWQGRTPS